VKRKVVKGKGSSVSGDTTCDVVILSNYWTPPKQDESKKRGNYMCGVVMVTPSKRWRMATERLN